MAVVLQGDWPASRHAGQLGVVGHRSAIEFDRQPIAPHRDEEAVPFAERMVGLDLWSDAGADLGRHFFIDAIAENPARTDRAAPDVDLALAVAAQIDSAVAGILHRYGFRLAVVVLRVLAAGQNQRAKLLFGRGVQPPI